MAAEATWELLVACGAVGDPFVRCVAVKCLVNKKRFGGGPSGLILPNTSIYLMSAILDLVVDEFWRSPVVVFDGVVDAVGWCPKRMRGCRKYPFSLN